MKYVILILVLLTSCHSIKNTATTTLSIDSTYWNTSMTQSIHEDIQDKIQMSIIVEKKELDTTTGNLRIKEATRYNINGERRVRTEAESTDTILQQTKRERENRTNKSVEIAYQPRPPDVGFWVVLIVIAILTIKKI